MPNQQDKLDCVEDTRLIVLHMLVYPTRPFNRQAAIELQRRLWTQQQTRNLEQAKKRSIEQAKAEKDSVELHREVAELILAVDVFGEDVEPNGKVVWDGGIKDLVTGVRIGTPRSLMNEHRQFEWRSSVDCRVNLERHLDELRKKYDGFEYRFSFNRQDLKSDYKYKERYVSFRIVLSWKPATSVEAARKLKRLVTQTAR